MSARTFSGHFDNPTPELTVGANPDSQYAQFSLRHGQAAILDAHAVAEIVGQLSAWLAHQMSQR